MKVVPFGRNSEKTIKSGVNLHLINSTLDKYLIIFYLKQEPYHLIKKL